MQQQEQPNTTARRRRIQRAAVLGKPQEAASYSPWLRNSDTAKRRRPPRCTSPSAWRGTGKLFRFRALAGRVCAPAGATRHLVLDLAVAAALVAVVDDRLVLALTSSMNPESSPPCRTPVGGRFSAEDGSKVRGSASTGAWGRASSGAGRRSVWLDARRLATVIYRPGAAVQRSR
jgi:hypothetical protein